jgi:hypothetical protein
VAAAGWVAVGVAGAAAAGALVFAAVSLPDLNRYRRLRRM